MQFEPRIGGDFSRPDRATRHRLKVHTDPIPSNTIGDAYYMTPQTASPYYSATAKSVDLYVPAGMRAEIDDEVWATWHPAGQVYFMEPRLSESWVIKLTTTLTAASGTTFGSGTAKLQSAGATTIGDLPGPVTKTIKSMWPYAIPSDHYLFGTLAGDGTFWATEWLSKPHLLCRFTAGAAFTQSSSSVSGTIQSYYGFGASHSSSSATFNNLLTATASTYLFRGASGAAGLAYYTGSGTTWQIIQMECPDA